MLRDGLRCAALAIVLVVACRQITLHGAYGRHPGYRAQVDALLDGRLALTTAPDGLVHDLAWTPHGVQQVWGLGVPLWQLPFELIGRAVGYAPFPDRVALTAWLAVMLFVLLRAFRPLVAERDRWTFPVGAMLLTGLLPGLLGVLRGRIEVYEEAAIYAYGAAMILLGGLIALHRAPTTARYLALVAFAGLTGLLRPTVWFYGLATALIASALIVQLRGRRAIATVALGAALFVAGGAALYATNAERFGRGSEFGHRLNIHSLPGNLVATRFSYPFERAGIAEASEELVGSLFDGPERRSKRGFYQTGLHRGQSPLPRWREYYFTTFSWLYAPAIAAGLVLAVLAWRRRGDPFARLLGAWAVVGGAPLFVFYLHSPSMASRYQLDLAPAIAALLLLAWRIAAARWPRYSLAVLAIAWAAAVASSKVTRPRGVSDPVDRETAAHTAYAISRATAAERTLPAAYDLADPFLPAWTDVIDSFTRCSDRHGAPIDCASPSQPGDAVVRGVRIDRQWLVDRYVIPGQTCAADPTGDPGSGCDADAADAQLDRGDCSVDTPACAAPPALADDPAARREQTLVTPPALYLNGSGWDLTDGRVPPATFFYIDDPAYLLLDVVGPPGTDWQHAVRAVIGLDHLKLVAVADTADGAQLRFEGEPHPGLQVAFIAFGPDTELDHPLSAFRLRSIRWRD